MRPDTGARSVACDRRVWVSDRAARAEADPGGRRALVGQGGIQSGLREEAFFLQFLRPAQGGVVAGGIGLGGLYRRLLLAQLGAQQGVVQLHQGLALTDIGAFVHQHGGGDQAAGLGADGNLFPGRNGAGGGR